MFNKLNFSIFSKLQAFGFFFFVFFFPLHGNSIPEKSMVLVIPSYNNSKWLEKNLNSIFMQKYSNYRVIYVNDASQDQTGKEVEKFIKQANVDYQVINFTPENSSDIEGTLKAFIETVNHEKHLFTLINNTERCGALANIYRSIYSCNDSEIILLLDGDDWFYHEDVLNELNIIYSSQEVWFTHGTLIEHPTGHISWCEPIPKEVIENHSYRQFKCPSHLKTFYSWLFKQIKLEDLLWDGQFFPMTWDMAIMYPICEMAQERHAFVEKANYVYNMENSINDNKVNPDLQNNLDYFIRHNHPYNRLESKF